MTSIETLEKNELSVECGDHILLRLTYISRYNDNNANVEIARILEQAQRNNVRHGITGVLIINDNYFLQNIEGARSTINTLLQKLIEDSRHSALQVVECCEINERRWSKWSMKYLTTTEKNESYVLKFSTKANFDPYLINAAQITNFIDALSEEQRKAEKRRAKREELER